MENFFGIIVNSGWSVLLLGFLIKEMKVEKPFIDIQKVGYDIEITHIFELFSTDLSNEPTTGHLCKGKLS